jgi:cell filamentation protein, protein adenylyltransferase
VDLEKLKNSPIGTLVPIQGHDEHFREFSYFAFLPAPLPSTIALEPATWTKVAAASEALGRLHQACLTLPNPRLLIAPTLAREAVDTSALEGTYGALADVLEARLTEAPPSSPEIKEIRAYEHMAHLAFDWVAERPITVGLLSHLQGMLAAAAVEREQRDPGEVRKHQVVIGPKGCTVYEARFIPPPPDDRLQAGLDQWQQWLEDEQPMPAPLKAAIGHYQFESLHPFGDGNGRIGRLVIMLQLLRSGILSEPAISISSWLRKRRDEYQSLLLQVSQTGDWNQWVSFLSQALCDQSIACVSVVDSLNRWLSSTRQTLIERHWTGTVANILEDLVTWPVISSVFVQAKYGVSAPTAKSVIDRLVEIGVLHEISGRPYRRRYAAGDVINAVERL